MKKRIRIVVFVVLALVVAYLVLNNRAGTYKTDLRDFAVQDTALIDKIFLADKQNKTILLERKANQWMVNGVYPARQDLVNVLLKTMLRIKVKDPVPNAAKERAIKILAAKSTKVEIYEGDELSKVYYVGGTTKDSHGTYMIMEGSASPFIVEIPGFRGFLSSRYTTQLKEWRSHMVFSHGINSISEIVMEDINEPENSYIVKNSQKGISLYTYPDKKQILDFDPIKLKRYLLDFGKVGFSKFVDDISPSQMDSVVNSAPFARLTLVDKHKQSLQIAAYRKPGWDRLSDQGEAMKVDVDYFFITINSNEMVYAQYYVFDPIFRAIKDFK